MPYLKRQKRAFFCDVKKTLVEKLGEFCFKTIISCLDGFLKVNFKARLSNSITCTDLLSLGSQNNYAQDSSKDVL